MTPPVPPESDLLRQDCTPVRASAAGMIDQDDAARLQLAPEARVAAIETAEADRRAAQAAAEALAAAEAAAQAAAAQAAAGDDETDPEAPPAQED